MQPVRIKLYGLFSVTKGRYLFQAAVAVIGAAILLGCWYVAWPGPQGLHARLTQPDLPPSESRAWVVALMDNVPWILLVGVAYQAAECYLVLRLFARGAARPPAPPAEKSSPKPPPA